VPISIECCLYRRQQDEAVDLDEGAREDWVRIGRAVDPGEQVLWAGHPAKRWIRQSDYFSIAFGIAGLVIGSLMVLFATIGDPGGPQLYLLGPLFVCAGVAVPVVNIAAARRRENSSTYGITDRRVIVVRSQEQVVVTEVPLSSSVLYVEKMRHRSVTVRFGDPNAAVSGNHPYLSTSTPWGRWEDENTHPLNARRGFGGRMPHLAFHDAVEAESLLRTLQGQDRLWWWGGAPDPEWQLSSHPL
jgi:hypothetical protein